LGNPHHPRPAVARQARPKIPFKLLDPERSIREQGFYYGFPCHLGHTIRHEEEHWCYECVRRIQSNVVGLDVNFINEYYRDDVIKVLNQVSIRDSTECWENNGSDRLYFSSWNRLNTRNRTKIKVNKLMYTLFWGDVGKLHCTRHIKVCNNHNCVNPLHSVTSWNTRLPPRHLHYLDTEMKPEKLAVMALREHNNMSIDDILMKLYKPTILHPKERMENP
jgi:hypothetical protein